RKDLKARYAERDSLEIRRNKALATNAGAIPGVEAEIAKNQGDIDEAQKKLKDLELKAPQSGLLIAPELENRRFAYIKQSDRLGIVADLHHLIVRAAAPTDFA